MAHRLAGDVGTTRRSVVSHIDALAAGHPDHLYGVEPTRAWTRSEIFDLIVEKVGIRPDDDFDGFDIIDPELTVAGLLRYREVLERRIVAGSTVLFATAHPDPLVAVYARIAAWALRRGAVVVSLPRDVVLDDRHALGQTDGIVHLRRDGEPIHSHDPEAMKRLLATLDTIPDLVVADHGWAGAAGEAGLPVIAWADCNDPALFVGEAQGSIDVAVPIDDGLDASDYNAVLEFVLID